MAASTQPIDGSIYKLDFSVDAGTTWKTLGYQKDNSVQISTEFREITSKTQCDYREKIPTVSSWSMSGTAEYYNADALPDDVAVFNEVLDTRGTVILIRQQAVNCSTGVAVVGESKYSGSGFWSSLDVSFPEKDTASYSYTFEGSGALTETVIV